MNQLSRLGFNVLKNSIFKPSATRTSAIVCHLSIKSGEEDWNDAWETAWLPEDLSGKNRAPWETDVNFSVNETNQSGSNCDIVVPSDIDSETKNFVDDMTENWEQRKGKPVTNTRDKQDMVKNDEYVSSVYRLEDMKRDYRLKKQRIHAGLWMKEIEKMEEAKLADSFAGGGGDDIDKLLDSCSEIFDFGNNDVSNGKVINGIEMKNKPDGWETTSKGQDGSIWEMSQREEDILLQEFERRIAYNKYQIASFIKQHIFSRRRPIDGWKYMIEEIGPNAKKGKGSVNRLASVSDPATQPLKEEKMIPPTGNNATSHSNYRGR